MEIIDLSAIVEKHGIKGTIFVLFVFFITALFKSKWMCDLLSKLSDKFIEIFMRSKTRDLSKIRSISSSDITNHDIFNYIDFWMYSKIPTFQFSTEYRTAVFRKYLIIYLRGYKKSISKFINDKEYQEMDDAKLSTSLLNMINMTVYEYEKDSEEVGIPKIVIEKMKFKNYDTITLTMDLIEGVCGSQFHAQDKNLLKVYSILTILLSVLENTINNSNNVCNSINGALTGLTFEGKTETKA